MISDVTELNWPMGEFRSVQLLRSVRAWSTAYEHI